MADGAAAKVDVAIVGAGLSGLTAARALVASGYEPVVLEARDRVGGRLLGATLGEGVQVELGAQWVGSDHRRVQDLAGGLGIGMFPQPKEGRNLLDVRGTRRRHRGTIPRLGPGSRSSPTAPRSRRGGRSSRYRRRLPLGSSSSPACRSRAGGWRTGCGPAV